ncbi:hypothetical protein [Bacillus sp. M6-12]|uniref:hypothetical protein n=1 Tax=Bacillus sp. M6-12 TaxID=2054166 RepID=UPI00115BEC4F|nr:hypothetical protein [Bacillus sp. M6-12]
MKLFIKNENQFMLEGSGKDFKLLGYSIMRQQSSLPTILKEPSIIDFYQSLLRLSTKDNHESLSLLTSRSSLDWLFQVVKLLPKTKKELDTFISDLHKQYMVLQQDEQTESHSLKDSLIKDYQDILGLENIKKMTAFIQSFELTEDELQSMIIQKFLDSFPSIKPEDIRIDMLERMYDHFFSVYQSLLIETHLIYPFPLFQNQLAGLNLFSEGKESWTWIYLLYFDMFLKGVNDGIVYEAEDSDMLFDWFKPFFIKIAEKQKEKSVQIKEQIQARKEKDMIEFRNIYIQELSKCFQDIERIEEDKEIPYNVVFILKDNRKIVCNTLKHYQVYREEIKSLGKEQVKSMKEFIQKVAPISNQGAETWIDKGFDEVKKDIYPMIRLIESTPEKAIYSPLTKDMGIYYGIRLEIKGKVQYAIIMRKTLDKWGITVEVLNQTALSNLQKKRPTFVSYQEVIQKQLTKEELNKLPSAYKNLYMYAGKSSIDSSNLLNKIAIDKLKESLNTEELIFSVPVRDCLLVTKKEELSFLKQITEHFYQSHSARLSRNILEWSEGEWKSLT